MKHKYAEMIKAKVDNMDLVVLCEGNGKWYECECEFGQIAWWEDFRYFLCLPQHKDACLHWLNGGKAEALHEDFGLMELTDSEAIEWGVKSVFMKDSIEIRIKPKKEKRLIVYRNDVVYGPYIAIDDINADFVLTGQVVEIEVEV
ncbi:hypothetical protein VPHK122_0004 [Vibrio phage K122]